jgi:hypothetical protein
MTHKDDQTDPRDTERAPATNEETQDLPVPSSEADKVKGGAVGPCDRPKK